MFKFFIYDGSSILYRSYFALPPLKTSYGFPTNAIYGFLRTLFSHLKLERPKYLTVCFDLPKKTKRKKIYKEYKAKRPKAPNDLVLQIKPLKEILRAIGINYLEREGLEADDLIVSLVERLKGKGLTVKVFSPDKDLLQVVDESIFVVNPISGEVFTKEKVLEKFGVEPKLIPDLLALRGDSTDNIKGIEGVGDKTALKILRKYGSVEGILKRWEEFSREFPRAKREELTLSYELVRPIKVDLNFKLEDFTLRPNLKELRELLKKYEMRSLLKEVDKLFQRSLF